MGFWVGVFECGGRLFRLSPAVLAIEDGLTRSGQLAEARRRGPGSRKEREPALDPLALAGPGVSAPNLCRVGGANGGLLPLGRPLLRAHEKQRQKARRHPPRAGLQVDSHLVEMLAGPPAL